MVNDKLLLKYYMLSFNHELDNVQKEIKLFNVECKKAYELGRIDAIAGDDVSSVDLQTTEEILIRIGELN